MKSISLILRSRDDSSEKIAELNWELGKVRIIEASRAIAPDLDRLVSMGLIEWVGLPGSRERRHTLPTDIRFLDRIADYFARQSGFAIKLIERETTKLFVRIARPAPKPVRGAIYMVNRSHEPEMIVKRMQCGMQVPSNPAVSMPLEPSLEQRRVVYSKLLRWGAGSTSHMKS